MKNHLTLPSCLYLQQQNSGFSQNSSLDPSISPEICTNMNDDFGSHFCLQSEGFQSNLNYSGSGDLTEFSYFSSAVAHSSETIDAVITPTTYQSFKSDNLRVSRKRPLEELVFSDGIAGLISNSVVPHELKVLKDKSTMDTRSLKVPLKRSQKLTDKITSLQKIVSPYGKTDTASVLQETCMYIKIAHQEIRRLTVSCFETRPIFHPQLMHSSTQKWNPDLKSRGLCLVPLSYTNQLSAEEAAESSTIHQGVTTVMDSWRF